jgi:hypothetical protein
MVGSGELWSAVGLSGKGDAKEDEHLPCHLGRAAAERHASDDQPSAPLELDAMPAYDGASRIRQRG